MESTWLALLMMIQINYRLLQISNNLLPGQTDSTNLFQEIFSIQSLYRYKKYHLVLGIITSMKFQHAYILFTLHLYTSETA